MTPAADQPTAAGTRMRVQGLDSIRFVCAVWVFWSHLGVLDTPDWVRPGSTLGMVKRVLDTAFHNGPSAVIVFFVISGFCIHLPNARRDSFGAGAHYARRFLRILPPMLVALLLGGLIGAKGLSLSRETWQLPSILWSLVAELVYYAIYPGLLRVADRIGWTTLLAISYVPAAAVVSLHADVKAMPTYGYHLTWIVGLPCWLLGCVLAERRVRGVREPFGGGSVPWLRAGMFVLSAASWQTLFRGPSILPACTFVVTLHIFALAAFFWLGAEMDRSATRPPSRWMEWAGAWSYSLYLMHELGRTLWERLPFPGPGTVPGMIGWTVARMAGIMGLCWVFHLLVEAPSHRLARAAGRRFRGRAADERSGAVS